MTNETGTTQTGGQHNHGEKHMGGTGEAKRGVAGVVTATRDKVADAYEGARESMADTYANARAAAGSAGRRAAEGIDDNPVVAVVGGLALGAVAAALIPRSDRETKALGAIGGKINQAAQGAVQAARDAGQAKLGELGLDRAKDTVLKLVDDVVK